MLPHPLSSSSSHLLGTELMQALARENIKRKKKVTSNSNMKLSDLKVYSILGKSWKLLDYNFPRRDLVRQFEFSGIER